MLLEVLQCRLYVKAAGIFVADTALALAIHIVTVVSGTAACGLFNLNAVGNACPEGQAPLFKS